MNFVAIAKFAAPKSEGGRTLLLNGPSKVRRERKKFAFFACEQHQRELFIVIASVTHTCSGRARVCSSMSLLSPLADDDSHDYDDDDDDDYEEQTNSAR